MADNFGLNFSPSITTDRTQKVTDPNANVQDAIRTLSLNIPRVVGAKSVAPSGLLNAPGSQGFAPPMGQMPPGGQNNMGLEQILALLFGNQNRTSGGSAPTPNVIPGINPGEPSPGTFNPGAVNLPPPPAPMGSSVPTKFVPEQRMPDSTY